MTFSFETSEVEKVKRQEILRGREKERYDIKEGNQFPT